MPDSGEGLARRIETIESSYEYLLAYAAQGRQHEQGTDARTRLTHMYEALGGLAVEARSALGANDATAFDADVGRYLEAVGRDAEVARGAIALVLRRGAISSLLVDNLNASVHLRALLTDLFLLEQAQKS